MFKSVLIANRGEIAVRITKTLRRMGIRSVVVASIPDRHSLAVRSADALVLLEGYSAAESYLDVDAVFAAARAEGCDAIHPGYGFLSERADFAERCEAEGITFIGPPPAVLRGMGDKAAARQLAVANGVPVVPGWDGEDDPETLVREAARIGYPVMLKARGGGGGRGMREVFAAEELPDAIESARREALAAFGDEGLLLERLVTNAHHVEVQVLADTHGNVIHLGERDCSVQRRHQKLIEETPSPVVDDALRAQLTGYALKLARAINYVNAGTFEFLVEIHDSRFTIHDSEPGPANVYFLEVNPRLQVEHPVTEMVTGLDLVELQLRVAAGEELPMRQEDVTFSGHAIEFRINAEDPWDGFKPSSGRISRLRQHPSGRADFGFGVGDDIPTQYDSLIGKVIQTGKDRADSIGRVIHNSEQLELDGVDTNVRFLQRIAQHEEFSLGLSDIGWLERETESLLSQEPPIQHWAVAARIALVPQRDRWDFDPWLEPRWLGAGQREVWLSDGHRARLCRISGAGQDLQTWVGSDRVQLSMVSSDGENLEETWWQTDSPTRPIVGARKSYLLVGAPMFIHDDYEQDGYQSSSISIVPPPPLPRRAPAVAAGATAIVAPLSGTVAAVRVAEGDAVETGAVLLLLEAMKMEHRIVAPGAGVVKAVLVKDRDVVREGDVLVELGPAGLGEGPASSGASA